MPICHTVGNHMSPLIFCFLNQKYLRTSPSANFLVALLTLYLLVSSRSADNYCKQFGPRSGPTERRSSSGSKMFDTDLIIFLKKKSKKLVLKKIQQTTKKARENIPKGKELCLKKYSQGNTYQPIQ